MAAIDPNLREFVQSSLRSIWALELLLHLHRQAPAAVAATTLVRELRASDQLVASCLSQLEQAGLIAREAETARYIPASPTLAAFCDALAVVYRERPRAVMDIIVNAPPSTLKNFADAFRFREKDE